jgi:hypothetical protein
VLLACRLAGLSALEPRDASVEIEMVRMIRIVLTEEAFEAIKATMPLGSVGFEKRSTPRASARSGLRRTCSTSSRRCADRARAIPT